MKDSKLKSIPGELELFCIGFLSSIGLLIK